MTNSQTPQEAMTAQGITDREAITTQEATTQETMMDARISTGRLSQPASKVQILLRYTGWEFWRNLRMVDSTFFVVILPSALYLMFGVAMDQGSGVSVHGNVTAYVMTSMAVYGAVVATTAMAGTAAVERNHGWGRQLAMTGLSNAGYFTGKTLMSICIAIMPILVVFALGLVTGAEMDGTWRWFATAGLTLLVALPFALYGLAAALLFRSETAVSAASGFLVVFAFFGNLFIPLSGTLLDIAKFTPLYGVSTLARWPQMEGFVIPMDGTGPGYQPEFDSIGFSILNLVAWTAIFGAICMIASRRRTQR
ncbi:MAG: ABC transporter permease [Ancrocorticia sp.]|uniref:ABC transporter permease n=1 Tax=Ancrocorticia sp. TaxID=2593684 RepID=UPI003F8FD264